MEPPWIAVQALDDDASEALDPAVAAAGSLDVQGAATTGIAVQFPLALPRDTAPLLRRRQTGKLKSDCPAVKITLTCTPLWPTC